MARMDSGAGIVLHRFEGGGLRCVEKGAGAGQMADGSSGGSVCHREWNVARDG